MNSIWENNATMPTFPKLKQDLKTDVLIVGGGIAGIVCQYLLNSKGIDCVLTEQNTICSGITKNTTAKITVGHGLIYDKIINNYGIDKAYLYLKANQNALKVYKNLSKTFPCDYKEKSNFIYSIDNKEKIEKEILALERLKYKTFFKNELPLPISISGAIEYKNQAEFNPLKFLGGMANGQKIFEHTKITEIKGNEAFFNGGKITAKKIIIATHFPFMNKRGGFFLKMYQDRSYVLALKNAPQYEGMYRDENEKGLTFRNYKDYLLLGGGSHRTGKQGGGYDEIRQFAKLQFPQAKEKFHFATQDCMTLDSIPYIGRYSKGWPNVYVATGFNKWGMTSSMVAASVLTDLILKNESKYDKVFSPQRSMLHLQLLVNSFEAVSNILRFTDKRCPHLGCKLNWNKQERSWDCPCHGSRFAENGKLLDNPATNDLK